MVLPLLAIRIVLEIITRAKKEKETEEGSSGVARSRLIRWTLPMGTRLGARPPPPAAAPRLKGGHHWGVKKEKEVNVETPLLIRWAQWTVKGRHARLPPPAAAAPATTGKRESPRLLAVAAGVGGAAGAGQSPAVELLLPTV
jgi:hypothetical protein